MMRSMAGESEEEEGRQEAGVSQEFGGSDWISGPE